MRSGNYSYSKRHLIRFMTMRVSLQLAVLRVACLSAAWQSARALLTKRFELLLDGSTGELAGSYTTFQFRHIYSCGAQCAGESGCWAWSYDTSSAICHVFPSNAAATSTTGTPTSFRTYSTPHEEDLGYYVPMERCQTWVDGYNTCVNAGFKMAFEPDVNAMKDILDGLSETTIFIGLKRISASPSSWQDIDGNEVPYSSIAWQEGQPDNAGGNENRCLCYMGKVADVNEFALFDPKIPVLCAKKA